MEVAQEPIKENSLQRWLRMFRPLSWWILLLIVLFGLRTHQRLMEETILRYSIWMDGHSADLDSVAQWDGQPIQSGTKISLGYHTLSVTNPKGEPFSYRFFVYYGPHDLHVQLRRSRGTMIVRATPPAESLAIRGPEYAATLTQSEGGVFEAPTDDYEVEAHYAHWTENRRVQLYRHAALTLSIAPPFGAIRLSANYPDTTYELKSDDGRIQESGSEPALITKLPQGYYHVSAEHHGDIQDNAIVLTKGLTNEFHAEFAYGGVSLETDPPGAEVTRIDGQALGKTPLLLAEVRPGEFKATMKQDEFEPVTVSLQIEANKTNSFQTNLLNTRYVAAMNEARRLFAAGNYDGATAQAETALKFKEGDADAQALRRDAEGFVHLAKAKALGQKGDFEAGMAELNTASNSLPSNSEVKQLLGEYKQRKAQLEEEAARQRAEQVAAENRRNKIAKLDARFDGEAHGYEKWDSFARNQLIAHCAPDAAFNAIRDNLEQDDPKFQIKRVETLAGDTYLLGASQDLPDGHRECVMIVGQISPNETLITFKSLEYQTSHSATVLGGLVTVAVATPSDQNGDRERRFQEQIKEGVPLLKDRVRKAIAAIRTN